MSLADPPNSYKMPEMTETKNLPEATITDVDPKDADSDTDSEDTIPELEDPGK